MGKFLAIVFLIVFAFWAYPHVANAQWFSPTPTPSYWWGPSNAYSYPGSNYQGSFYGSQNAGWFNLNFWTRRGTNVNVGYGYQQPYYYGSYPNYSSYNSYRSGYSNWGCSYTCGTSYPGSYTSWNSGYYPSYGNSYYSGYYY